MSDSLKAIDDLVSERIELRNQVRVARVSMV
jgi:hypothetical protein